LSQLYAVELDAQMAYVPDEFERIVKGAVDYYYHPEIWEEVLQKPEHSSDAIRRLAGDIAREWLTRRDEKES
jgi:hypothetical protein